MCADVEQPYCGAPRCERWCQQDAHCERAECSGCDSCAGYVERGVATERPAASPFPAPVEGVAAIRAHEASPTCDENFLGGLRAELRSLVGAQTARNNEIRAALGLSTVEAAPPGEPRPPPPPPFPSPAPPPCVPVGAQCGGSTWSGHTSCCRTASNAETVCRWYSDAFSGCREVGQQ